MADKGQKTEKPTPRRLQKAREEGRFLVAREFLSGAQFLVLVALLGWTGTSCFTALQQLLREIVRVAFSGQIQGADWLALLRGLMLKTATPFGLSAAVLVAVTLGLQLTVTRFGVSFSRLTPDLSRLNPINKLRDLPRQGLTSALEAIFLLPIAGLLIWTITRDDLPKLRALPFSSVHSGLEHIAGQLERLFWKVSALLFVFGAVDLFRQTRRYTSELKMSKQEIKEELKQNEGSPHIKGRIRRMQRTLARRKMLREVATATAVVVNPTHYAVAIRYHVESMPSPVVVAKGKNLLAKRIREKAIDHNVPIFEQPPLARGLYEAVEAGQEIPAKFYRAVAEILAFVYRQMGYRMKTGA